MNPKSARNSPGLVYRLLSLLLLPFWLVHGLRHGSKFSKPDYLASRLGKFSGDGSGDLVWVHASSVGEVQAVTPLVTALLDRGEKIMFTCFTATGLDAIQNNFSDRVHNGVIPIDLYWLCQRFLAKHRFKLGLVMETELWPELLYQARMQKIPLLLINARLSPKTSAASKFVRQLAGATLRNFERILTRNESDRKLLLELGADDERIVIVGNLKTPSIDRQNYPRLIERDYILLASSHAGEEKSFARHRPPEFESSLLVIAPRHPRRSAAVQNDLAQLGLDFTVRSKAQVVDEKTAVYLADTLGEMKPLMAHARIVVMGGSFNQSGGHNLLEPASLGCAIITGPSDNNIRNDIKMLDDGVIQVGDMAQCWRRISDLVIDDDEPARQLGKTARKRLSQQPDMVEQYLKEIETWL